MKSKKSHSAIHFAVVATDVACFRVIDKKLSVLIAKTPLYSPYPGKWALIGGIVESKETTEDTTKRLLKEKAGIHNIFLDQVHTFSGVDRDPRNRVVSVAYLSLTHGDPQDASKASLETKWFDVEDIPKLAYDHNKIFEYILKYLRFKIRNTDFVRHLLPKEFTLSELQETYEAVVKDKLDKRNFRKKMLASDMLKSSKRIKKNGVMRPAILYMFK